MKIYLKSHPSEGAKQLALAMMIPRIKERGSNFVPGPGKCVINWGLSELPANYDRARIINKPTAVSEAVNKLTCFQRLDGKARVVPYTTDKDKVKEWLGDGNVCCARRILRGSGGDGLSIFSAMDHFEDAPLWTQYIKKREEFRVHILGKDVISLQRKAKRTRKEGEQDPPEVGDNRIRNLANGYIFARNDIVVPDDVLTQAKLATAASGLDFGAVDVIWNEKRAEAYVLEINTAPGLEGQTIQDYKKALLDYVANL